MPALRPIHIRAADPASPSLAGVLVFVEGLEEPFDWRAEFGGPGPLKVEVGPGKGIWLANMCAAEPESLWIGIEYKEKRARWIAEKMVRRQFTNSRVIWSEALEALGQLFEPGLLSAIHVNFPDPWPKRRHRRRRLVGPEFCGVAARALASGGELQIVTDVAEYAREMLRHLEATGGLTNLAGPGGIAAEPSGYRPSIHYVKFAAQGRTFNFLRFRKG